MRQANTDRTAAARRTTRIVSEVERKLSVIEELETVVSANLKRAARLRQSILQKAFSDRLVKEPNTTVLPDKRYA